MNGRQTGHLLQHEAHGRVHLLEPEEGGKAKAVQIIQQHGNLISPVTPFASTVATLQASVTDLAISSLDSGPTLVCGRKPSSMAT